MAKSYFDQFIEKVEKGRNGEIIWIPSPYKRWKNRIGISKRFYTLIGGDSGSGKSAFLDSTYILHTYNWYKENEDELSFHPKIILRSMERSKEYRIAKWVCQRMFEKYNILIDVKTVFGMHAGDSRINDDLKKKIESCRKFIEEMQEYVTVIDGRSTPTGVFKDFRDYALKNGDIYHHTSDGDLKKGNYTPQNRKLGWEQIPKSKYPDDKKPFPERYEKVYIADDQDEIVIPIVDHIQKYVDRTGWNSKQTLDKATEFSAELRDLYGMSPINISQFNRNKSDSKRRFNKSGTFKPEENDFKGSGDMYEDCDVCIGLFNPHEYGIDKHQGYNIKSMVNSQGYNRFRSAYVLKNTYGPDNFGAGFHFIGEIGQYNLLPKPKEMDSYKKYASIEQANNITDIVKR